jgi:hypothetical protein
VFTFPLGLTSEGDGMPKLQISETSGGRIVFNPYLKYNYCAVKKEIRVFVLYFLV